MKKRKVLFILLLAVVMLLSVSCNNSDKKNVKVLAADTFKEQTREYAETFSSEIFNKNLTEKTVAMDLSKAEDLKELSSAGYTDFEPTAGYDSRYEKVTVGMEYDDIASWGVDNNLIFPGSILRVQNPTSSNSTLSTYGIRTGDITISTDMYTSTGTNENSVSREIKNAELSSTRTAIKELISANLVDGSEHAFNFASTITEVKSQKDLEILLGVSGSTSVNKDLSNIINATGSSILSNASADYSGSIQTTNNAKVVVNSSNKSSNSKSYICVQLTQIYYSIDTDNVYNPMDIIRQGISQDELDLLKQKGGVPCYVSSIKYGRKAIVVIESNKDYSEFVSSISNNATSTSNSNTYVLNQAQMNALIIAASAEAGGEVSEEAKETAQRALSDYQAVQSSITNSSSFIIGGSISDNQMAIGASSTTDILSAFNSKYEPSKMIGVPISFNIRYMDGSNSIAKVGNTSTYYQKILTPIPVENVGFNDAEAEEMRKIEIGTYDYQLKATRRPEDAILYDITYEFDGIENQESYVYDNGSDGIYLLNSEADKEEYLDKYIAKIITKKEKSKQNYYLSLNDDMNNRGKKIKIKANCSDVSSTYTLVLDKNITVTYNSNGGSEITSDVTNINKDYKVVKPSNPVKENDIFLGWVSDFDSAELDSTSFTTNTFRDQFLFDTTLFAKWSSSITRTIVLEDQFFTRENILIKCGDTLTLPNVSKIGYTFNGWYLDGTKIIDNSVFVNDKNIKLIANYTPNTYKITFDTNDGFCEIQSKKVTFDGKIGVLPVPTKEGYSFTNWSYGKTIVTQDTMFNGDFCDNISLLAEWEINEYLVSFDTKFNDLIVDDKYVKYDNTLGILSSLTKAGYTFNGWTYSGNEVDSNTVFKSIANHNIVLMANWEANTYMVSYNANEGTLEVANNQQQFTYNEAMLNMPTCISPASNISFAGWYLNDKLVKPTDLYLWTSSIVLSAKYSGECLVSFDANGGNIDGDVSSITGYYLSQYGPLLTPARRGYTFNGWYLDGELVKETTICKTAEAHTLVANWTSNKYRITFDANGGDNLAFITKEVWYDKEIGIMPTVKHEIYEFAGWYLDETKYKSNSMYTNVDNITLTARWNDSTEVTFDANGGIVNSNNQSSLVKIIKFGDKLGALPEATRPGYTFAGWYNFDKIDENQIITKDFGTLFVALWLPNTYNVAFDLNGGERDLYYYTSYYECDYPDEYYSGSVKTIPDINITNDSKVDLPTNIIKEDYVFAGWYLGEQLIENGTNWSIPENATLKAYWVEREDFLSSNETIAYFTSDITSDINTSVSINGVNSDSKLAIVVYDNHMVSSIPGPYGEYSSTEYRNPISYLVSDKTVINFAFGYIKFKLQENTILIDYTCVPNLYCDDGYIEWYDIQLAYIGIIE